MCLIEQGRFDDAIAVMRPFVRAHQYYLGPLGSALAKSGKTEEAWEVRDRALQFWAQRREGASDLAEISLGLGDTTEALNWLAKAIDSHTLAPTIMGPTFASLRRDPRLRVMTRAVGMKLPLN